MARKSAGSRKARPAEGDGMAAAMIDRVFENPAMSGGLMVVALTATAIVSNAMFLQNGHHPDPLFSTRPATVSRQVAPRPMAAKIYWDDFNYWAFVCQYFFKEAWKLPPAEHAKFVAVAREFATLQFRGQKLVSEWATILLRKLPQMNEQRVQHVQLPPIPSILANAHLELEKPMTPDETLAYMHEKLGQAHEVLHEIILRAFDALQPELQLAV